MPARAPGQAVQHSKNKTGEPSQLGDRSHWQPPSRASAGARDQVLKQSFKSFISMVEKLEQVSSQMKGILRVLSDILEMEESLTPLSFCLAPSFV